MRLGSPRDREPRCAEQTPGDTQHHCHLGPGRSEAPGARKDPLLSASLLGWAGPKVAQDVWQSWDQIRLVLFPRPMLCPHRMQQVGRGQDCLPEKSHSPPSQEVLQGSPWWPHPPQSTRRSEVCRLAQGMKAWCVHCNQLRHPLNPARWPVPTALPLLGVEAPGSADTGAHGSLRAPRKNELQKHWCPRKGSPKRGDCQRIHSPPQHPTPGRSLSLPPWATQSAGSPPQGHCCLPAGPPPRVSWGGGLSSGGLRGWRGKGGAPRGPQGDSTSAQP